jgi:dimethylhistidine N-methyltransferase
VLEFGAGSLRKVRLLLSALDAPARYIPIDISGEHLQAAAHVLRADFPCLDIAPLVADYTQEWVLPARTQGAGKRVAFFPGSTIGNFAPPEARQFLRNCAQTLPGGALLLGADLIKHPDILHAAYNDAQGVTAAFNLNLLERANRELGATFKLHQFAHCAFYNAPQQRIEMHLVSTCRQTVRVGDAVFSFEEGETLHTENSYKFTIDSLHRMARDCGLVPGPVWTDPQHTFGLLWLDIPA